jgi:hypothetical protein
LPKSSVSKSNGAFIAMVGWREGDCMDQATTLQFERIANEFALWRGIAEDERSPAPAWWWGSAMVRLDEAEAMPSNLCDSFELPPGSSYGSAAEMLMQVLAEQTSLAWPDEFPRKQRRPDRA